MSNRYKELFEATLNNVFAPGQPVSFIKNKLKGTGIVTKALGNGMYEVESNGKKMRLSDKELSNSDTV